MVKMQTDADQATRESLVQQERVIRQLTSPTSA